MAQSFDSENWLQQFFLDFPQSCMNRRTTLFCKSSSFHPFFWLIRRNYSQEFEYFLWENNFLNAKRVGGSRYGMTTTFLLP